MPYFTLTADHVKACLSAQEYHLLTTASAAAGAANPVIEQLTTVTGQIRSAVRTGGYGDSPSGQIPEGLKSAALDITVYRLAARLNIPLLTTPTRERLYNDALALLKEVAAGRYDPNPDDAATAPEPTTPKAQITPTFSTPRPRRFSRTAQDGA